MSTNANIGALTVQLRDRFGNLARATTGGVTVNLAASPAGTDIFGRTAGATTAVTTVQIGAPGSATSFYFGSSGLTATTVKTLTARSATGLTRRRRCRSRSSCPTACVPRPAPGASQGVTGDADCSVIAAVELHPDCRDPAT